MLLSSSTLDLMAGLASAIPEVGACLFARNGEVLSHFGDSAGMRAPGTGEAIVPAGRQCISCPLASGETAVVSVPAAAAARVLPLVRATLELIAQRQHLEHDMESMNHSSMQLLEQVAMLGETLPRLSAAESDPEIATAGLRACVTAAGVDRAVYLRLSPETGVFEALVFVEMLPSGQVVVRPYPMAEVMPVDHGVVADVLAAGDTIVLRQAPAGGFPEGLPESLARREVLGVQVGYEAGGKRNCLGAILLFDKSCDTYEPERQLGSEEGQVALSFASMLGAVLGARQTAVLGKELSMAQVIQGQILPSRPAIVAGFELAGDYRTSGEVGGDYFDYVPMADGRTLVVVADVSGHNLASGMMMVSARATLRTLAAVHDDPAQVFEALGASMFQDLTKTERFITAAGVALRPRDHVVQVVNAGHNDLMLFRARDRQVQRLPSASTILGFVPRATYASESVELEPGDLLLLYTDGVTEATDAQDEMFGDDRLAAVVGQTAEQGAREVVAAVLDAVRAFRGRRERGDDVTVVAIKASSGVGGRT